MLHTNSKPRAIWSVVKENLNVNEKEFRNFQVLDLKREKFNNFFLNNAKQNIPESKLDILYYLNM